MRRLLTAILWLAFGQAAVSGHAAGPRELIHPYPPTGPVEIAGTAASSKVLRTVQRYSAPAFTDLLTMHVAQTLQADSGDPVTVTRKPRRGGVEAALAVSLAAADGRTLLLASSIPAASTATGPRSNGAVALRPVALVASMPFVMVATGESRHATLRDLIHETQRSQQRVLIATAGEKSVAHPGIELLRLRHALRLEPVPYNGGNAALQAIATKQVDIALVPLPSVLPYLGGGRIKALAVAEPRRNPAIPHVPTAIEQGVADLEIAGWFGVFAPAATPRKTLHDLNAVLSNSPRAEQTRQVFSDLGLRLEHRAADAFAELLLREQ